MSGNAEYGVIPTLVLEVRQRRGLPLDPAGALDRAGLHRLLGPRHARDDGHRLRRGLHDLRRSQGPEEQPHLLALRSAQRAPAQTTTLALSLGTILSGALLVEIVFGYPGMGSVLFRAVSAFDYFTIYGVVFFIIVGVALATLILDLIYPILDPRIRYHKS